MQCECGTSASVYTIQYIVTVPLGSGEKATLEPPAEILVGVLPSKRMQKRR